MDRQVRLVAGTLVLTGAVASLALPAAVVLPIGVGAGLTFSALSNSCAMAALLGRLPYNSAPAAPTMSDVVAQLRPVSSAA